MLNFHEIKDMLNEEFFAEVIWNNIDFPLAGCDVKVNIDNMRSELVYWFEEVIKMKQEEAEAAHTRSIQENIDKQKLEDERMEKAIHDAGYDLFLQHRRIEELRQKNPDDDHAYPVGLRGDGIYVYTLYHKETARFKNKDCVALAEDHYKGLERMYQYFCNEIGQLFTKSIEDLQKPKT